MDHIFWYLGGRGIISSNAWVCWLHFINCMFYMDAFLLTSKFPKNLISNYRCQIIVIENHVFKAIFSPCPCFKKWPYFIQKVWFNSLNPYLTIWLGARYRGMTQKLPIFCRFFLQVFWFLLDFLWKYFAVIIFARCITFQG